MPLMPFVQSPKFEPISKTIQFCAYKMMSRLSENRYESDLIDHFFKIDSKVWLTFGISLLILYVNGFVNKLTFKTFTQIKLWRKPICDYHCLAVTVLSVPECV